MEKTFYVTVAIVMIILQLPANMDNYDVKNMDRRYINGRKYGLFGKPIPHKSRSIRFYKPIKMVVNKGD